MNNDNTKVCTKCNVEKPFSEFQKRSDSKDGLAHWCKLCKRSYDVSYISKNKEKVAKYKNAHYLLNKETYIQNNKKWHLQNPGADAAYSKKYRQSNPDKRKETIKKYYLANKDKVFENSRKRRSRVLGNDNFYVTHKFLKKLYSSPCVECGSTDAIEADHIIPVSKGGGYREGNLQPMCRSCNASKSNKFISEWKASKLI